MQRDTMGALEAVVRDAIEGEEWPDLVNPTDLAARLNRIHGSSLGRAVSGQKVAVLLKEAGAVVVNGGAMVRLPVACATGSDRVRLFSLRDHEIYSAMPAAALARKFLKNWAEKDGREFIDPPAEFSAVTVLGEKGSVT
jgi:hypothetical protein